LCSLRLNNSKRSQTKTEMNAEKTNNLNESAMGEVPVLLRLTPSRTRINDHQAKM